MQAVSVQMGQELYELACRLHPAVILLDAELPGERRGWEAARTLQAEPATCDIPIISCSWLTEPDARALIGGLAAHLQKPELHYDDFAAALRAAGIESGLASAPPASSSQPDTAK